MLCICTSVFSIIDSSEGIDTLEIGDFKDNPESFFSFHIMELNSEITGVRALIDSACLPMAFEGSRGKERTSTELLPYKVEER